MSRIFFGEKVEKPNNFDEIIENIGKKQKEIIEKLKTKFNIFDSEKRKYKLNMLSILWSTYLSTLGTLEDKDFSKEDFNLITSLTSADQSTINNFVPIINAFKAQNVKIIEPSKELFEANLLKLDKKKSDLKSKSFENKKKEEEKITTCIFCVEDFDENDFMNPLIMECKKHVHGKCFVDYIEEELNNNRFPIKCPLCAGNERHEINYKTILDSLLLNDKDNLAAKLENISLNHLVENNPDEITFCPTAGCKYMCSYDKNEFHLECPMCQKSYCLQCKTEWHKDMTCQEYQRSVNKDENDTKFEEYIKGNRLKQCPKCKRWVEKISGCNHIQCSCGTAFCYNCGNIKQNNSDHGCRYCNGSGLFGNINVNQGGLFGNNNLNQGGLFGNNNANRGNYLFGNNNVNQGTDLFGNNNNNRGGLFGNNNNNNQGNYLFGNNNNQGNYLFGNNNNNNQGTGLFGNNNNQGTGLFGNNNNNQGTGLFGNNNNNQGTGLFGNNNNNHGGLFGNNNNNNNNNQGNYLFGY